MLFIFLTGLILQSNSLAKELQGKVTGIEPDGKKVALPKANIFWLGTKTGAIADVNGNFTIDVPDGANRLVSSFIGYDKDTILVDNFNKKLEIELKANYTLRAIQIDGEQPARLISNTAIKSETITANGLRKAACCNLSESFQTNPTVDVSFTDAVTGAKQIQLLGLQGVYIQMLNEKVPSFRGLSANFGLDYIPGPWMKSIQISKGASSVQTGFESISGQIDVEYKVPEGGEPLFLNFYANQLGRFEANAYTTYHVSDKIGTMLFAHASSNQVKHDNNSDGFLDKPLTTQFNLLNRWAYEDETFCSKVVLKALYEDRAGGQIDFYPAKDKSKYYGMDIRTEKYEMFTSNGIKFDDEYSSLGTNFSLSHYKLNSYFNDKIYDGEHNSFYANLTYQSQLMGNEEHSYSVGLGFINDVFTEVRTKVTQRLDAIPGAFLEYTYKGIEDLTVIAGMRYDYANDTTKFFTPRLHLKYNITDDLIIRASAGKGFRIANVHAENIGMFASSRTMTMLENLKPEEAWNYGINGTWNFDLFNTHFILNADFYRTDFINQVIVDMDRDPNKIFFHNLKGESYSNSFQVDLTVEPFKGLTVLTAFRMNDVKMTINGELLDKPLQSRKKGFINLGYLMTDESWSFDFTAEYNGSGRIPNTKLNPDTLRLPESFDPFVLLHTQVTKRFGDFEIYLGGENLTNYTQSNPILSADKPFEKYFDSGMIWAPIVGRVIYTGFRWTFK
ncbi:MAG: hypothetical protein HW421_95 [Ignavibacteria bacterium]|nr:hypothetical protein [Ignavibacteria bacterium]